MSPDGARIAFDSDRDGDLAAFFAGRRRNVTQRVSGEGVAAMPRMVARWQVVLNARGSGAGRCLESLEGLDLETGTARAF